jgi:2-phospho-L-lactate guanylyltransferase
VLVLPADLPLINAADVVSIITLGQRFPSIVLAPDQQEDGTNALFMRPPGLIAYAYGTGSYERHQQLATEAEVEAKIYRSDQLALDVDISTDLDEYHQITRATEQNRLGTFASD